jgi:hypothetical protein
MVFSNNVTLSKANGLRRETAGFFVAQGATQNDEGT